MRKLVRVVGLMACLLLVTGAFAARAGDIEYLLDVRGSQSLVLLLPSRELAVRDGQSLSLLGLTAYSARYLPDGDIAAVDTDLALWRIGAGGPAAWLPPGSVNAPLFVSPDGRQLAYTKPNDFEDGSTYPLTNGIAVLDLQTGQERRLMELPGLTIGLYGWSGNSLIIDVPTWDPQTLLPAEHLTLALLPADGSGPPERLAQLPRQAADSPYPQTSFDQNFLSYEGPEGVVLVSLADASYAQFPGRAEPMWAADGLTTSEAGARRRLDWAESDLSLVAPSGGPLLLPELEPLPEEGTLNPNPGAAQDTTALLFFRPVVSSVRVSAYVDLEPARNRIRDGLGWVGTSWISGRAYDNHRGTDYAAPLSTPVYASATGTVDVVRVQCGNFYQGGPAGFGTYVRIDHGQMSDGSSYRTLYGHMRCDGVSILQGTLVATLPTYLGQMGSTGTSTGPHVHLEVYRNSLGSTTSVDPYDLRLISDNPSIRLTGDLSGVVLDSSGQPAAGALVKVVVGASPRSAITGADGGYSFPNLPGGNALLTAVRGRRWASQQVNVLSDQQVTAPNMALTQCRGAVTAGEGCPALVHDAASFVDDITIPDGLLARPNQSLVKTWRLANTGTTTWGNGYQLVFLAGEKLNGAPAQVQVGSTPAGGEVNINVSLQAPAAPGVHRSYWRMRNPQGVFFGPTIWLELETAGGLAGNAQGSGAQLATAPTCSISAPASSNESSLNVSWNVADGTPSTLVDVQFLESGRGPWRPWLSKAPPSRTSAVFSGHPGRHYSFRCRATDQSSASGGYSDGGATTFVTVTPGAGAPDLRIASLTTAPAPGGGVLVEAVIQNQASASSLNGFYTDIYLDHAPVGAGDYIGSVFQWVTSALEPGASQTLTAVLSQGSGTRSATVYAQVDSTNAVAENDEGNNRHLSGLSVCIAAEDVYEDDGSAGGAKSLPAGASQARTFGWPGDHDWIRLDLGAGRYYQATTSGLSSGVDTRLMFFGSNGTNFISGNDDYSAASRASRVTFAVPGPGPVYLLVDNWNPAAGGCGASYTVSVADFGPAYSIFLPLMRR